MFGAISKTRPLVVGAGALGVVAVAGACAKAKDDGQNTKLQLHPGVVAAAAGAVGEVAALALLYPLDTIKVRCQAAGLTAREVVAELLHEGVGLGLAKKLWAGVTAGLLCSVLVGAVHFASYDTARRLLLPLTCGQCQPGAAQGPVPLPHGHGHVHGEDEFSMERSETQHERRGRAVACFFAAALAAAATALVESPVELFRHNAQAGLSKPNFVSEMVHTARRDGLGGLYWGFLPHCFEAWPHDISELLVYGAMRDLYIDSRSASSPQHALVAAVPLHAWDLATGAASGAAAVVVSHPLDVTKTYLQTHGTDLSGRSLWGSARLFVRTAQRLAKRGGPGALYVGLTPRLLQQVPSAMVCWWAIENFTRALQPYTGPLGQDMPPTACALSHTCSSICPSSGACMVEALPGTDGMLSAAGCVAPT